MKLRPLVLACGALLGLTAAAVATPASAATDPVFRFTNIASGRCLDAKAQQIGVNGTPVQLWDCYGTGQLNQVWTIHGVGAGRYQIISKASGRCLDATSEWHGANGTPIQLWDCYGAGDLNQIWYLYFDNTGNTVIKSVSSGRLVDA
jgi:hypothetical protein